MRDVRRSAICLLIAVLCTGVVYVLIMNALRNPVDGSTAIYHAQFTDVSGVRAGADVRRQGVQVGKVISIKVVRDGDANIADVEMELMRSQRLTTATHMTVKFQNLTGARYVDIRDADISHPQAVSRIPLAQTTGSFDMTTLFNGLAPVLRTLDPADVNEFTAKLATFLEGDGAGASDLINSIRSIAGKAADQDQTINTLVDNISLFATGIKGRSDRIFALLANLKSSVTTLLSAKSTLIALAQYGPNFTASINRLVWVLGLRDDADLDKNFDVMRANLYRVPEFFERLPGVYVGMQPQLNNPGSDLNCTDGRLVLPPMMKVFLADESVVLCNR
ncbi:Mce family protein [Mycobacteroides abscessus subsp. abscessus]|nr:Mce family protein [Mycobacteroides abscessus subsp. abscessus]